MKHAVNAAQTTPGTPRHPQPLPAAALLSLMLLALPFVACGGTASSPQDEPAADAADTADTTSADGGDAVAYEPAYPEEVSEEGLSDEDVGQQAAGEQTHDGEGGDHEHGDDGHQH